MKRIQLDFAIMELTSEETCVAVIFDQLKRQGYEPPKSLPQNKTLTHSVAQWLKDEHGFKTLEILDFGLMQGGSRSIILTDGKKEYLDAK